ncbi:MAG: DUF4423 domain-containing protein [Deltaproteobacteria bacterium]|nr:DUF4423 domain-containing protein [Deltaproteobacteria bacterium]
MPRARLPAAPRPAGATRAEDGPPEMILDGEQAEARAAPAGQTEAAPAEDELPFTALARELLVAARGRRSQAAWSKRLGYRSNVAWAWEQGRRWPTAAEALRACAAAGVDLPAALTRFYGRRPAWLDGHDPTTTAGVAALLEDLRGNVSLTDLARRAGASRFSLSRWLAGLTEPKLPDFLRLVQAASLRAVDLIAVLADPATLPIAGPLHARLDLHRRAAAEAPWLQAVVHGLELTEYRALPGHQVGWLSARLDLPPGEEDRCIALLSDAGRIRWRAGRWEAHEVMVDTRPRPEVGRALKAHWARVGADYALAGKPGQFSYNVFSVSTADFERIRAAHLDYFRLLRSIVSASQPEEIVAVANVQLFALAPAPPDPPPPAAPGRARRGPAPPRSSGPG